MVVARSIDDDGHDGWRMYDMAIPFFPFHVMTGRGHVIQFGDAMAVFLILIHIDKMNHTLNLYFARFTQCTVTFAKMRIRIEDSTSHVPIYKTKQNKARSSSPPQNAACHPRRMQKSGKMRQTLTYGTPSLECGAPALCMKNMKTIKFEEPERGYIGKG
jgi:hypothetical protein